MLSVIYITTMFYPNSKMSISLKILIKAGALSILLKLVYISKMYLSILKDKIFKGGKRQPLQISLIIFDFVEIMFLMSKILTTTFKWK